jgi:thioredoxin 1
MADKITVAKINIDENPNTPTQFGVRGIPTMLVFKNGEAAATKVGAVSKTAIVEWIEDSIA